MEGQGVACRKQLSQRIEIHRGGSQVFGPGRKVAVVQGVTPPPDLHQQCVEFGLFGLRADRGNLFRGVQIETDNPGRGP